MTVFVCLAASEDFDGMPADMQELLKKEGFDSKMVAGLQDVVDVGKVWSTAAGTQLEEVKQTCEKIFDGLTKAAETPHDIFKGLKIFASTMRKAIDMEADAEKQLAALNKGLGLKDKFVQAVSRLTKKVEAQEKKAKEQAEAMAQAAKLQAEKQAQQQEQADDSSDMDDDSDFDDIEDDEQDEF